MASRWLSKRLAALASFPSEVEPTTRPSTPASPASVVSPEELLEISEEDLIEFSTHGNLTDINLSATTPDEKLGWEAV